MPDVFVAPKTNSTMPTTSFERHAEVESNQTGLFTNFCQDPSDVSFQTQEPNETILLFTRRHPVTNVPWLISVIALATLPFLLSVLVLADASPLSFLPPAFTIVITIFYYAALFTYAFVRFMSWYYNIGIITNMRVVDIDFSDVVYHDVAQTKLTLIDDVNYTQSGVIRTFFNYGDLFVQTAGGKENIEMLSIPTPSRAAHIIANLIGKGGSRA